MIIRRRGLALAVGLTGCVILRCAGPGVIPRHFPHPLLLIHGLGGTEQRWEASGTVGFLKEQGLAFGGALIQSRPGRVGTIREREEVTGEDFFTLRITDPVAGLEEWAKEIEAGVKEIRRRTGAERVILVGYSAGGVAARRYLVMHPVDHHVKKIVTVASPHLGSELALASALKGQLEEVSREGEDGAGAVGRAGVELFDELETRAGVSLDSPLVRELMPEEQSPVLRALNRTPHPTDVEYVAVLVRNKGEDELWQNLHLELMRLGEHPGRSKVVSGALSGLARTFRLAQGKASRGGDGVVLLESQDLRNVEFFQHHPGLVGKVVLAEGTHQVALERYEKILDALSGEVEFAGAEWSGSERRLLHVEFRHDLGPLCKVRGETLGPEPEPISVSRPTLVVGPEGPVMRAVVGPVAPGEIGGLTFVVETPGEGPAFSKRIIVNRQLVAPLDLERPTAQDTPLGLRIASAESLPRTKANGKAWDLGALGSLLGGSDGDGSLPDVRVSVFAGELEVATTAVAENVWESVSWQEGFELNVDPGASRISLRVWDEDGGLPADLMGTVTWNPGDLPVGSTLVKTDSGILLHLETRWHGRRRSLDDGEPFYLPDS